MGRSKSIRPGPWYPSTFAQWRLALKHGFRKTRWPAPLGWDDPKGDGRPTKLLSVAAGVLCAIALLSIGLVVAAGWIPVLVTGLVALSMVTLGEALPATARYEVIISTAPSWRVGEDEKDRDLTDPTRSNMLDEDHYPGDYTGMVLVVKESPVSWRPGDLASPNRQVVGLDLTTDQANALRSKRLKVDPITYTLGTVTAADHYGATLPGLVAKFGTVEAVETAEMEAEALEASSEPNEPHELRTEFTKLTQALPKNIVHSGAGLYEVGPGKTYATFTLALAQLWTDQGSATFTQSQYIRGFADTYVETIAPSSALTEDNLRGYELIIEGDPGDDRDNIIIQPSVTTDPAVLMQSDTMLLRHLRLVGQTTDHTISCLVNVRGTISDCHITSVGGSYNGINVSTRGVIVEDCTITVAYRGVYQSTAIQTGNLVVRRCWITKSGSQGGAGVTSAQGVYVSGCVIDGFSSAVDPTKSYTIPTIANCTFYDCQFGIFTGSVTDIQMVNTIVHTCEVVIRTNQAWPDEATGRMGGPFLLRNNCYYNYTDFASSGLIDWTYAQFTAFDRVDAAGDLDATNPLFTTPGSDFSLQVGSPCRHAGHGSGVITDYLGTAFDPNEPDIGAWSSGPAPSGGGQQTRYLLEEA